MLRTWLCAILMLGIVSAYAGTVEAQQCTKEQVRKVICTLDDPPICENFCDDGPPAKRELRIEPEGLRPPPVADTPAQPPIVFVAPSPDPEPVEETAHESSNGTSVEDDLILIRSRIRKVEERFEQPPILRLPDRVTELEARMATLEQSQDKDEDEKEPRAYTGATFGFQLGASTNIHVLAPYEQELWDAGGDLEFHLRVSPVWRLLAGPSLGYAGMNRSRDHLRMFGAKIGAQPHIVKDLHFVFGFLTEQRLDDGNDLNASTYAVFLGPKYCPGSESHRFCVGARAAVGATIFSGPETGEVFARGDGIFGINAAYALMP